jgi:hypothetical protein
MDQCFPMRAKPVSPIRRGPREAREAPGDQVAVVRVADSRDDEEDGRGDEEQGAKTEVHRGSFRDWQELYARMAHPANAC